MKPGIHKMSNEAYHSGLGLSSTGVKELVKSAAHYQAYLNAKREPTAEMIRGTVIHAMILEPESFDAQFAVGDFKIRRGKEYESLRRE
jgi:hypothetical protein